VINVNNNDDDYCCLQVYNNQRHRAFLQRVFGTSPERIINIGRNDYMDDRSRRLLFPPSGSGGMLAVGNDADSTSTRTFPGMVPLSPRRFASRSFNRERERREEMLEGRRRLLAPSPTGTDSSELGLTGLDFQTRDSAEESESGLETGVAGSEQSSVLPLRDSVELERDRLGSCDNDRLESLEHSCVETVSLHSADGADVRDENCT